MPEQKGIDRRRFMKQSAWGLGLGMSFPGAGAMAVEQATAQSAGSEASDSVVVFQGDSITDAGRSRDDQSPNQAHSLGNGYVALAAAELLGEQPGPQWQCYNRGISGNKVFQLADRWEADCLDLAPDVLSILIGVNDFWHALEDYDGTVAVYERDFRALLERTKEALPDVRLIIGEPFAVEGGTAIDERWADFASYRAAARRVARDYNAVWIPYQSLFDEALKQAPASYWCPDGVHPSPAGNYRMAQAWLDAFHTAMNR